MPPTQPRHSEQLAPRRARLRPPRLPGDVLVRPRLLARLNRLPAMALIVAPAGYGKTTLVGSWLAQVALPTAWLSLGEEDNDPATFLAALIAAMRAISPDCGRDILETLYSPNSGTFADLGVQLVNELNALGGAFVLVLEDYHEIREPTIHQFLLDLITYPPRAMHLVLTARHDPPLPWRMRVRADLCELRGADLNFTEDEAMQFLAKAADRSIGHEEARALVEQSQGWITSLRLAALAMRRQGEDATWSAISGINLRNFNDYFREEVLRDLGPETKLFLLRTSVLEILSGPLCDFVLGGADGEPPAGRPVPQSSSAVLLREFERAGVFTMALDDQGVWYRYHPLLRAVLRQQLAQNSTAAEIADLYGRAARWHEDHGFLDEALRYALASGDMQHAVEFLQRHRCQLQDNYEWQRLVRWLQQFPASAMDEHIELILARAWVSQWRHNMAEIAAELEQLERLLAAQPSAGPHWQEWRAETMALRSHLCAVAGDGAGAVASAQVALANMAAHRFYMRTYTFVQLTVACQMIDQRRQALAYIAESGAEDWAPRDLAMARSLHLRAYIDLMTANLDAIRVDSPTMLQLVTARDLKTGMAWGHYYWACACYLQNDLPGAAEHFRAVAELADHAHAIAYVHSMIGLALTCQAQGLEQEAAATIESVRQQLAARQQYYILATADACAAELAAQQGRVDEALRWVERAGRQFVYDAYPAFYVPGLAFVRVLLAGRNQEHLRAAGTWLDRQMELAVRTCNTHVQIQATALEAALHEAQGDRAKALSALARALATAERGQVVRVFVNLAPQLAPLFDDLPEMEAVQNFAARVRTAIAFECEGRARRPAAQEITEAGCTAPVGFPSDEESGSAKVVLPGAEPAIALSEARDLSTLLTYREMDVLRLLEQRLTNKEIAHELGIATETVRQHTVNLFRKLGVENRRQAVVAARNQGLFGGRT